MQPGNLNKTVGENIRKAIRKSGLNQEQISARLNISRQTLGNYISGSTPIAFEKLFRIADLTGKNMDFFYKSDSLFGSYKLRSDVAVSDELRSRFEDKIKKYSEIEKINKISAYKFEIDSCLDKFDRNHIEAIAQKIRCLLDIGPLSPITNPIYELEKNNVKIIQFFEDSQDMSGFSVYNEEFGYCIYLNSRCTIERRFFTVLHEIAHLVFHKSDYMCGPKIGMEKTKEDIADEFAGLFLVPAGSLFAFCRNNFIENIGFDDVILLKRYFNVSAKCMAKRLLKEGIIDKNKYEMLNNEIDVKVDPYSEYQPIEEESNIENYRFTNLVKRAFLNKEITSAQIVEFLEILPEEADKKSLEWSGKT